ncbi:hypothetical protein CYMTET_3596 [Cymbomonas tetramitiformis]|uniref:C3H1-type domain-containing protein n=1 Tax=Cymbomonas tetramitiformis TaxID=36881 RepID=A0AAE0LKP2_9CHLO|nr:hypothetical protein CYMTET_3596 [Cymbomonas tetramitiformis]
MLGTQGCCFAHFSGATCSQSQNRAASSKDVFGGRKLTQFSTPGRHSGTRQLHVYPHYSPKQTRTEAHSSTWHSGVGPHGWRTWRRPLEDPSRNICAASANEIFKLDRDEPVKTKGVITQRRTLGNRLTFLDLTTDEDQAMQLKCLFSVPAVVKHGVAVEARGHWMVDSKPAVGRRTLEVMEDPIGLKVVPVRGDGDSKEEKALQAEGPGLAVARPESGVRDGRLCKQWLLLGNCGDPECMQRHDAGSAELIRVRNSRSRAEQRSAQDVSAEADPDDPHNAQNKRAKSANDRIFADWIVDTFGREALARGGVADIAGGKGLLSFELHVRHGIACTLVEPRPCYMTNHWLAKYRAMRRVGAVRSPKSAEHQAWQRAEQWMSVTSQEESAGPGAEPRLFAAKLPAPRAEDQVAAFRHARAEFGGHQGDMTAVAVAECAVLIGMHPDEVTEAIVDAALRLDKPFAVVPCCVFTSLFPERRLHDGGPVKTYTDLVTYLKQKDPSIQIDYLPFKGRNRVLYRQ